MNQRDNRIKQLLLRLQRGERFTAREAAVGFEVDEKTIRRDIDKLRTQGRFAIESDYRGFWMRKATRGERDSTDLRFQNAKSDDLMRSFASMSPPKVMETSA